MTSPKKDLRSFKKNKFGYPTFKARSEIGEFDWNGKIYNQIHVYATAGDIKLTLYSTTKKYGLRPDRISAAYDIDSNSNCHEHNLRKTVEDLITKFKVGPKEIKKLNLKFTEFAWVLY